MYQKNDTSKPRLVVLIISSMLHRAAFHHRGSCPAVGRGGFLLLALRPEAIVEEVLAATNMNDWPSASMTLCA